MRRTGQSLPSWSRGASLVAAMLTAYCGRNAAGQETPAAGAAPAALVVLQRHCTVCHGDEKQESGLDLRSVAAALRGGDSGPALVAGQPDQSLLVQRVARGEMPPEESAKLTAAELETLRHWIAQGDFPLGADSPAEVARQWAARGEHWSFLPCVPPEIPTAQAPEAGGDLVNALDHFVLAKLASAGLTPAPLASRRELIRRATFDLLGLPPTPERVAQFVGDTDPQAYAKLIEELLASPHYGERWARHWLDVARYADTGGYETDVYFKDAWRYRDYVVKSFNDDKPYDRFVQEQVAGDLLWPDNLDLPGTYEMPREKQQHLEAHIGTGFYALGPEIHESNMDAVKLRNERWTDWVDTTGAAFLGLTIGCARCHDHKFDPLTQADYYGLQAVFASSTVRHTPVVNAMEVADQKQHYPKILAVDEARRAYRLFEQSLAGRQPTDDEQKRRAELLAAIGQAVLAVPEQAASTPGTPFDGLLEVPTAAVLGPELPELTPAVHILRRGEVARPGEPAAPRIPEMLAEKSQHAVALPSGPAGRQELALWITSPHNPLAARVMVNRIWGWHFGQGLVATPNDFGHMGQPPTHPELLDWLAGEFIARRWSIKEIHRLILLSRTYCQSGAYAAAMNLAADPENRLLWRMNRRRLEAELIWDALHAVAGTLNLEMGGRPVMPPLAAEELTDKAFWVVNADPRQHARRGLYIMVRRNFRFPLFETFDAPVNAVSCAGRNCSTVAPQALWLINNRLAEQQARILAERVIRESGADLSACICRAWQLALQREASPEELAESHTLIELLQREAAPARPSAAAPETTSLLPSAARALELFCLALLNLNEFLYVD